uniref:Ig-like domain-containing protein n=1 Tax=Spermophilus dauricus TaxID=99837 RepID=A0A8C9PMF2_SPEDA
MTEHHAGKYQCLYLSPAGWSERSDPLELVVTGERTLRGPSPRLCPQGGGLLPGVPLTAQLGVVKPWLSALPSPVVTSGGNVTLQCGSGQRYDRFVLTKEGGHHLTWTLDSQRHPSGQFQAEFSMRAVTPALGGTYRCYGSHSSSPYLLSQPSAPLDLVVSGERPDPILCDGPFPPAAVVTPGVNVTLRCRAPQPAWRFALFRAGESEPLLLRDVSWELAEFFLEAVSPAQGGSYHCCYRRLDWGPGIWSQPSDVLELLVTGEVLSGSLDYSQGNLIRLGLAGLVLMSLGVLVVLDCCSRSSALNQALP